MQKFEGRLKPTPGGRGGTFVAVPPGVASTLGLRGMPKINAVIAGKAYRGSLMPMGDGTYCLGVLKSTLEETGLEHGDMITVELEVDAAPRVVVPPADLARILARDAGLKAAWARLSFTNQKEMARSLEEAKKPETLERRLAAATERLRGAR